MTSPVTTPSRRILVVEDIPTLRINVVELLIGQGMIVRDADTVEAAVSAFQPDTFDVVLLDITLHGDDEAGFRLFSHFRKVDGDVGIVFWTSHEDEAMQLGALRLQPDDYISKGSNPRFLVARVNALCNRLEYFRQRAQRGAVDQQSSDSILQLGRLTVDASALTAQWNGSFVDISLTQFWILQDLVTHVNEPRSSKDLAEAAKSNLMPNTITQHIRRIRTALVALDSAFDSIKTVPGHGYRWVK